MLDKAISSADAVAANGADPMSISGENEPDSKASVPEGVWTEKLEGEPSIEPPIVTPRAEVMLTGSADSSNASSVTTSKTLLPPTSRLPAAERSTLDPASIVRPPLPLTVTPALSVTCTAPERWTESALSAERSSDWPVIRR